MSIQIKFKNIDNNPKNALGLLAALVIVIVLVSVAITFIDILSDKQFDSTNPVISDEKVQFELRKHENLFRDKIYQEIKKLKTLDNLHLIDSITQLNGDVQELKKYIISNKLRQTKSTKYSFKIPLEIGNSISVFIKLDSIAANYQINFDELNKILDSSKGDVVTEHDIKYGNFISTNYVIEKRIRYDYLILTLFFLIFILTLNYFRNRIGLKKEKPYLEYLSHNVNNDKKKVAKIKSDIDSKEQSPARLEILQKLLEKIQTDLEKYNFDNLLKSVMYEDLSKSEKKANELYSRSTLMLVLGLLVGVVGILVFYITLPELNDKIKTNEYLIFIIRPTFVLIFIQSISIYLLRQYRTLIQDYKYFYNEYLKKAKLFTVYQLSKNHNLNDIEIKLIDHLLSTEQILDLSKEEDSSPKDATDILKTLIEQLKK